MKESGEPILRNVLPDLPGLERYYGSSIHHCPYCDAWEHRGKPLGVYGSDRDALMLAAELTRWSRDASIYGTGSHADLSDGDQLTKAGVKLRPGRIVKLDGTGSSLSSVHLDDGAVFPCEGLFFSPKTRPRLSFLADLGCPTNRSGYLEAAYDGACPVPGVFAAGNTCDGLQMVIEAAAKGVRAAHAIIQALMERDDMGG
jgi:thioredoxin reductase